MMKFVNRAPARVIEGRRGSVRCHATHCDEAEARDQTKKSLKAGKSKPQA
ncbi:MAG: hypothetical protein ACXW4P_09745 [Thermoanaerobaculia bacterium]